LDASPRHIKAHIPALFGPIYQSLANGYSIFEEYAVKKDRLDEV
jgi:hypothetical protein